MKSKKTLGLCVIAKDEEKNIARCIESVRAIVDEIVVVDTGSTDETVKIAEELGASVYYYPWDNSFSNAKNFAIGKTKSNWLLLLDADEALDPGSRSAVTDFINTTPLDGAHFRVRNYTGRYSPENYNLHSALRLLRNNGRYQYTGSIHEQLSCGEPGSFHDRFVTLDVILHHYGYLDNAVAEKQKRKRNIPMLEKELERDPENAFTLFNLGNEYLSVNGYAEALDYYVRSKARADNVNMAFVPHLYFRMANCYEGLGQYQTALRLLEEALRIYPACTDFEHVRANLHLKCRRYTKAVECLERCLKMGNPPPSLGFIDGCGSYRSAFLLGEIHAQLEDDEKALQYYGMTLGYKPNMYTALYRAGRVLSRMTDDADAAAEKLFSFFADPSYPPNVIVGADILLGEGLCSQALHRLEAKPETDEYALEYEFLTARACCLMGRHEDSCRLLDGVLEAGCRAAHILPGIKSTGAVLYLVNGLLLNRPDIAKRGLQLADGLCTADEQNACRLLAAIHNDAAPEALTLEDGGAAELETILNVLDIILRLKDFELLQQLMRALNYIDRKELLLRVAQIFWNNGFRDMAALYVLRSVKELEVIDEAGAWILARHIGGLTQLREDGLAALPGGS